MGLLTFLTSTFVMPVHRFSSMSSPGRQVPYFQRLLKMMFCTEQLAFVNFSKNTLKFFRPSYTYGELFALSVDVIKLQIVRSFTTSTFTSKTGGKESHSLSILTHR